MKSGIDENDMTVLVQEDVETDICLGTAKRLLPPPTTTTTTTTSPDSTLTLRNISLDRQSDLRRSWPLILAFLGTEMVKQLSNYAATQNNDDVSPMPPVLLVLLTELTKLVLVLCWAVMNRSRMGKWTPSLRFGIPAACYLATNVLYLLALRSTAPPLWLMLIQTRTFYTVAIYLVVFGREVSLCQIMGCLLVVASLPLAHASELQEGRPAVLPSVLVASQAAAFISTMASIVIELLLKNDSRSFCEQQTWLYCWSGLMAAISLTLQAPPMDFSHLNLQSPSTWCCVLAVVSSAVSGLCVPVIVRSLDTIAKDYLAALNNVLLALLTAAIFPRHFTLSGLFFLSLLVLLCGIWLYERKTLPVPSTLSRFKF
ncbi:uncharacterized protein LOC123520516 isoform X2 [Portunus trituberculatus]|uniref:uncharacterized protein LOC123520516 isoform X2 n=1 Tax=Portunus trituberculatus TaxID=210409 RepID=UPI001E1D00ED|nr:uncharacterized protein LOC123520516 isoform X2 [Portunus trituberculatus]